MKRKIVITMMAGVIALSAVGCKTEEVESKGEEVKEIKEVTVQVDEDGSVFESKEIFPYKSKGKLREIQMQIKDLNPEYNLIVDTDKGTFGGTHYDGVLYYIGGNLDEVDEVRGVFEEKMEVMEVDISEFQTEGTKLIKTLELKEGQVISGVRVESNGNGISSDVEFNEKNVKITVDSSKVVEGGTKLDFVIWNKIRKEITGGKETPITTTEEEPPLEDKNAK